MKKTDPKIKEIFNSALENHKKNKFEIAEKLYNEVIKVDPEHFDAIFYLGTLLITKERVNES